MKRKLLGKIALVIGVSLFAIEGNAQFLHKCKQESSR
jgi:hypothetical protein